MKNDKWGVPNTGPSGNCVQKYKLTHVYVYEYPHIISNKIFLHIRDYVIVKIRQRDYDYDYLIFFLITFPIPEKSPFSKRKSYRNMLMESHEKVIDLNIPTYYVYPRPRT